MPSLKRAWLQQRWRPLLRWGRMKMVCVDSLMATVFAFTSHVMHALLFVSFIPEDIDLELRLARFEQLIARRPLLLNSVLLRQNPHNVHEWHKRVKLYEGNPRQVSFGHFLVFSFFSFFLTVSVLTQFIVLSNWIHFFIQIFCNPLQIINTYTEAVQTVDPMKATGKPHSLWVSFAKFYEENDQLDDVSHWALSTVILKTYMLHTIICFLYSWCALMFIICPSG